MSPASAEAHLNAPPRIHVVEDERIVALDLRASLEDLGYQVTGISSSEQQAVDDVLKHRPDLVLMDINLGRGGDGITAGRRVLSEQSIPVVYLTAYAAQDTIDRAGEVAPYGYLLKPVEVRELNATIRIALARRRHEQAALRLQDRLGMALEAAQLGVIEISDDGCSFLVYGPVGDSLGLATEQDRDAFLAGLDDESRRGLAALLAPGSELHRLLRWQLPGGTAGARWLDLHARHFDAEGRTIGMLRDVSDEVEAANQLRQAGVVFASAADAIAILDADGRILSVNPSFESMTGWVAAEVRGQAPHALLQARRSVDQFSGAATRRVRHREVSCRRKDGSCFPAWEHTAEVLDTQGRRSHQVLTFSDISALREAEGQVRHLAYHDALTGLGNRHQLDQLLETLLADYENTQQGFSLLFLDLDGFKTLNDSMGHDQGDLLLRAIARQLRARLRDGDFTARLGGDEFIVVVRETEAAALLTLADKLLEACRQPVALSSAEPVSVSASVGVAILPLHATSAAGLVKAADSAMYAAKAAGRNCARLFSADMAEHAQRRLALEQGLHRALISGRGLALHWQPVVDTRTARLLGVEALMRWQSPQLGQIAPDVFIPLAEVCGLILELGRWVLNQALAQLADWRQRGVQVQRIAVNVSAQQLAEPGFAAELQSLLQTHGVAPTELELEVTESTLQSLPQVRQRLSELRALGVELALDDFGTGFSSLSSLKNLPLTRLKVDRSFVRDLTHSSKDFAIVHTIVELAQALQLSTTAEGVELPQQREMLQRLGVDACQGWLFAKALPGPELERWLAVDRR
jgi:diguanylate cyclase (GGDEF)-like protein/PAS domain S-box-containing protein